MPPRYLYSIGHQKNMAISERLAPAAGRNGEKIATNGSGGKRGVYIWDSSRKLQSLRKIKGSVPYHGYHWIFGKPNSRQHHVSCTSVIQTIDY